MCLRSSIDRFAIPCIYEIEGITTMPVPGRRCPACLERGDTFSRRSLILGFLLTSDPAANIGNGLKDLLRFSPGGTLFAFSGLEFRCGNINGNDFLR
ncbi:hypothetical protein EKO04_002670 [Ascochyta lentis]|uniref:Uncharacterized protein n=1 Tax=Ascochyta lentis TaxID=205686 RepID=A0A8H7ML07_9PLEO|nr:hypothetical protein EKO04_002670 [Ascochyta lentis]